MEVRRLCISVGWIDSARLCSRIHLPPGPFVNTFLKGRVTESFRDAYPASSIRIATLHYGVVEKIRRILSGMEKRVRFSGGAQKASAEDQRDRRFIGNLHKHYDKVVSSIRDAGAILILGPGEAKGELRICLESEALGGRVVGVETVDKMTDRQLAAKVRQRFSP